MSDRRTTRDTELPLAVADLVGHCLALKSPEAKVCRRLALGDDVSDEALAVLGEAEDRAWAQDALQPRTAARAEHELGAIIAAIDREMLERRTIEPEPLVRGESWRGGWWRWGAIVLLAAAVIAALMLVSPSDPEHEPPLVALGTTYRADPLPGVAAKRGSDAAGELPRYLPSSTLKLTLRPIAAVEGPIEVVGFARGVDGRVYDLEFLQHPDEKGVVEIMANVRDAGLEEGEWELMFVVGRPSALPRTWEEAQQAQASGSGGTFDVLPSMKLRVVASLR